MGHIARTASSISRRGFVKIAIAGVGAAYLAGNASRAWASEEKLPDQVKFAVMSDLQLTSPFPVERLCRLYDRRKLRPQDVQGKRQPRRFTFRGQPCTSSSRYRPIQEENPPRKEERTEKIVAAREQLKAAGVDTKFFVINGNHDVNN